ncbi:hypothetical protein M5Z55_01960 [Neisseria meningitidis]|uniref:hypothetical protein n=1 Tax=Neisseria meningitidis TaxID=487 RepID=UPI0018642385|nr:hypothetical protein [Neisseria meningitidis]MCL6024002.1 hypothetical protein [Neisseria meningitidis]
MLIHYICFGKSKMVAEAAITYHYYFFCLYNFKGIDGFYESCPILAIPVRG